MKREHAARILAGVAAAMAIGLTNARPMPDRAVQAGAARPEARTTLRVGLWTLWHDRELSLTAGANATVRNCERCAARALSSRAEIRAEGNAVRAETGGASVRATGLWLGGTVTLAAHGQTLTLHHPVAITARNGVLILAVSLPIENYVERVVASESNPGDTAEALKALAVVVRSYALHEAHGHADYDLCDSTHCQLLHWNGNGQRESLAEAAALATAGETLWFRGQRALAYFSKDCGGRTSSPDEVWRKASAEPFLPSRADPFCNSGSAEWASEIPLADLTHALAAKGLAAPGWQQIAVVHRGESGRVVTLRLDATEVSAEDFRIAVGEMLGWNKVPSTWFEVSRQGDKFLFHGRGWGHGVGLCQKGASAMGADGKTAQQILAQYFPGANAADEATGQAWKRFAGHGFTLESLDAADAEYVPDLEKARAEAAQRSGLNDPALFTVRAFASTQAFREATEEPGWVAAFARGDWIAAQQLRTLAARHLLGTTMRHEFLHALIDGEAGARTPLWLHEGLAEVWGADAIGTASRGPAPALRIDMLDDALIHAANENESEAAHRAAGWYAARLLDRYGREQVLAWLRSGIPASVVAALGQR